jgi:hypothetical protein
MTSMVILVLIANYSCQKHVPLSGGPWLKPSIQHHTSRHGSKAVNVELVVERQFCLINVLRYFSVMLSGGQGPIRPVTNCNQAREMIC